MAAKAKKITLNCVSHTDGRTKTEGVQEQGAEKIFGPKKDDVTDCITRSFVTLTPLHISLGGINEESDMGGTEEKRNMYRVQARLSEAAPLQAIKAFE
jgi:hypothetical protein